VCISANFFRVTYTSVGFSISVKCIIRFDTIYPFAPGISATIRTASPLTPLPSVGDNLTSPPYLEQLEKTFNKFGKEDGFAASYPIISIGGQRKYHLIFACAHPKAATLASNIVNSIEETFQREKEEYAEQQTGQALVHERLDKSGVVE
jgi:hypothetical protein